MFMPSASLTPFQVSLSLSPTTVAAGGSTTQPLAVTGTGFVPTSVILFNGAARTTTANAAGTTVTAILNAADLAAGGVDLIQVMNPGPGGGTSNTLTFAIDPTDTAGLPILVDYAFDGSQASNGICGGLTNCQAGNLGLTVKNSGPSVSQTGEFVAFASASSNLVANQSNSNAESQIFIRDTCLGETCTPATFVVSTASTGGASNGPSSEPSIDSTGTHVAYTSQATNLINYAVVSTNNRQVYWQPVCATGVAATTSTVPICTATTTSGSTSTINSDPGRARIDRRRRERRQRRQLQSGDQPRRAIRGIRFAGNEPCVGSHAGRRDAASVSADDLLRRDAAAVSNRELCPDDIPGFVSRRDHPRERTEFESGDRECGHVYFVCIGGEQLRRVESKQCAGSFRAG